MTKMNTAVAPARDAAWPIEVASLLRQVESHLTAGRPADALALLSREKNVSPWLQNARGVCQLRLGNATGAVDLFGPLVLATNGAVVRSDVPLVFLANYAAALLATGNLAGGKWVLHEMPTPAHPTVERLREGLRRWRAGLTFWQGVQLFFSGEPEQPPTFDFPLGDLA